ncbi:hypothetical protein N7541_001157 [Penicillium brevicompactum]|uniref:Transcription factor domain-containing protein n=1 Tax=Penicillium brevicompactum TaxID=5074 RepID=A0A9W9RVP0_PENBR|nr:hypothetical protein N7541_001157 [Penicillium brevicompactum]
MTGAISSRRREPPTAARCNNPGRIVVRLLITGLESRDVEASLMRSSADHAQLARPSRSSSINSDNRPPDTLSAKPSSATLLPTLAEFGEGIQPQLASFSAGELNITKADDALPREIDSLKSRTGPLSSHESQGLSSPHIAEGPLKALNSFRAEHLFESERNDPVTGSIITEGEAYVMFRLYFANCHPNTPFLDKEHDNNVDRIRSSSALLFLSILSVGARFWGASSKHDDQKLETVQALLICTHWMPFDLANHKEKFRSRFSESAAWQCLGLAIRWAVYMGFDQTCHIKFHNLETVTQEDMSGRNLSTEVNINSIPARLEPDPSVVQMMSFAIDHYHVVIAYAAFILVKSWLSNLTDMDLRPHLQYSGENLNRQASHSLLFRLVDLAARTLDAASPPIGHLARRYVPLLNGMAGLVSAGNAQSHGGDSDAAVAIAEANPVHTGQAQNALGDDLWEMWQEAGLEPMVWPSVLDEIFGEL